MKNEPANPKLSVAPGVVTRAIAGETLLVPVTGGLADMRRIFSVNPVAAFVWERLDGEKTLEDLARAVSAEFEVALPQALADVADFARRLLETGLARVGK